MHRRGEDVVQQLMTDLVIGTEHPQVHVAVSGVPASNHAGACSLCQLLCPGEELVHLGSGNHRVDDVMGADGFSRPKCPLPGFDQGVCRISFQHI